MGISVRGYLSYIKIQRNNRLSYFKNVARKFYPANVKCTQLYIGSIIQLRKNSYLACQGPLLASIAQSYSNTYAHTHTQRTLEHFYKWTAEWM